MQTFSNSQKPATQQSSANLTSSNAKTASTSLERFPVLNLQREIGNQSAPDSPAAKPSSLDDSLNTQPNIPFAHNFSRIPMHAPETITIQPMQPDYERLQVNQANSSESELTTVPPVVQEVLASSGQPLEPATREFMEMRFGHDFGRVRVHTNDKASRSANTLQASAYTVGHHLVFDEGQYAPRTMDGRVRLAHELAHVVQQEFHAPPNLRLGRPGDAAETEAEYAATTAVFGGEMRPLRRGHSGVLQRDGRKPPPAKPASADIVEMNKLATRQARTDVIKSLSGSISESDWVVKKTAAVTAVKESKPDEAKKLYVELYTEIATLAQVDKLGNGFSAKAINLADDENTTMRGLNFSLSFTRANGTTAFLDANGVNQKAKLPVTTAGLPGISILLGPTTFSLSKASAVAALRHEMMHAERDLISISLIEKWQKQNKGKVNANDAAAKFDAWLTSQKTNITSLEFDLAMEDKQGGTLNSELLGYLEGFMTIFHLEPMPTNDEIPKAEGKSTALLELMSAGNYWSQAKASVQSEALGRTHQYYCTDLDKQHRDVFDKWVTSKLGQASSTEKMSAGEKAKQQSLIPIVPFLKNLKTIGTVSCGAKSSKGP